MSKYKSCSDKTKCMCFMTKHENFFDKSVTISYKVSNVMKILIVNLYIIKKICKLKKDSTQNKAFNVSTYQ